MEGSISKHIAEQIAPKRNRLKRYSPDDPFSKSDKSQKKRRLRKLKTAQYAKERKRENISYIDGAEGMIKWVEDYVRFPIYPKGAVAATWRYLKDLPEEYHEIWKEQKEVLREALERDDDGFFRYKVIIFCWPRGEGKSFIACLVQMWKFFNFPRQQIVLGANSKDQVKFVHFDIIRDFVLNSPKLLGLIGKKNVQEKEIRIKDSDGNVVSRIRAISSFSGIVSNITGYTFSEMFAMKNPKFFVELDGSTRNIPNSLGVIDSTVSTKQHILYKLYQAYVNGEDPYLYFSYRFSRSGDPADYWNPHMTLKQLDSYRAKFPLGDFERFFLNTWSAGASSTFTEEMMESTKYVAAGDQFMNTRAIKEVISKVQELKLKKEDNQGVMADSYQNMIDKQLSSMTPIENYYKLVDHSGLPRIASTEELQVLTDLFDTNWSILVGFDRADPMKSKPYARTICTVVAKGLLGSRTDPSKYLNPSTEIQYLYVLLGVIHIESSTLEDMKRVARAIDEEYDGIDAICSERWGMWDMAAWCEEKDIKVELITSTYDRQKTFFSQLYTAHKAGMFKAPTVYVTGSKSDDIYREEAIMFYHDPDKRWFGSPEKDEKYGIQDDVMYSLGCAIYGGRDMKFEDFRERGFPGFFGFFAPDPTMEGKYK